MTATVWVVVCVGLAFRRRVYCIELASYIRFAQQLPANASQCNHHESQQ